MVFSWKRQRKMEDYADAQPSLGAAAAAADGGAAGTAAAGLEQLPVTFVSPSFSNGHDNDIEVATPCGSVPGLLSLGSAGGSIELASAPQHALPARGSVRSKAAYFEALCRSNTTVHIQCCAEECGDAGAAPEAAGTPRPQHGHAGLAALPPAGRADGEAGGADGGGWQQQGEFSEVLLRLRLPRGGGDGAPRGSDAHGSVADMEQLIAQLRHALELKEAQRRAAVDAFRRRSAECENLQRVVRELSEGRAKAAVQRAQLAERYDELQQEFARVVRIADLSRAVSKENLATTSRTRSELRRVQSELHATKSHALSLGEKQRKMRAENSRLRERVGLLERLDLQEAAQEGEVKKHFTRYRLAETY